jgi:biotin carboxyl carrier protein
MLTLDDARGEPEVIELAEACEAPRAAAPSADGLHDVLAPLPGTVYRAGEPERRRSWRSATPSKRTPSSACWRR